MALFPLLPVLVLSYTVLKAEKRRRSFLFPWQPCDAPFPFLPRVLYMFTKMKTETLPLCRRRAKEIEDELAPKPREADGGKTAAIDRPAKKAELKLIRQVLLR